MPYKFSGKERDEETGLSYFGARYYDATAIIWYGVDPLAGKYPGIGGYVYCYNNPIRFIDPTGMEGEDVNMKPIGFFDNILKALNYAGQEILRTMGLHADQIQSENPIVLEDARQKRQQTQEAIHTANETLLTFVPGGEVAYKLANDREVTGGDAAWTAAEVLPFTKIAKGAKVAAEAKSILNFSKAAAKHMDEAGRHVPVQILDDVIKTTKGVPDPQGSRALMHTADMVKNGTTYKIEVLYDKKTNSVWHFQYSPSKVK